MSWLPLSAMCDGEMSTKVRRSSTPGCREPPKEALCCSTVRLQSACLPGRKTALSLLLPQRAGRAELRCSLKILTHIPTTLRALMPLWAFAQAGALLDMYARSDITQLARGNAYNRLQWEEVTVGQALALAQLAAPAWPAQPGAQARP